MFKSSLRALLAVTTAVVLAGCLPIELDTSSDGKILIAREEGFFALDAASGKLGKLYVPGNAAPVFGRFVPGNKQILAVTTEGQGNGGSMKMELVTLADGKAKTVAQASNVTYLTVSSDGKRAAFARVADQARPPMKENLPELHVIDLAAGKERTLDAAGSIASIHRWLPDGKSMIVFQITDKLENGNLYEGNIAKLELDSGKLTPLAKALGTSDVFFDVSPDGKSLLFVATEADKPGAALNKPTEQGPVKEALFELKLDGGALKKVRDGVRYAMYSKTGKRVLVAVSEGGEGSLELLMGDASLGNLASIANDAVGSAGGGGMGPSTKIYPGWIGDDQIAYLSGRKVYGTAGQNLEMVILSVDGKKARSMQATIDAAAGK